MVVLAAATWSAVPDRLPVHWGPGGQPDRYRGKVEGLLADPLRRNYAQFAVPYAWARTTLSNQAAWTRTHQVGGPLFAAIGVISVLGGLTRWVWTLPAVVRLTLAWAVFVVAYSHVVWRSERSRS